MRGLRSTIVSVIVLAGLGAYIYFVTNKKTDTDTTPKLEKAFVAVDAGKIEEIVVKSESGDATTLKKDGGGWQIAAPVSVKADETEASGLATQLSTLEVSRVIDENPADLNQYGLATPRIEIDFKAAGDKDYRKLLVGQKTPTGAQLFATRNNEKRVFLIPFFLDTTFNKKTFDLRDKTLVKFDHDKVDSVEIVADGKTLQLGKQDNEWTLTKPVQAKTDLGATDGLISKLQLAQMKTIVTEDASPADLKKYGLDKPAITVNVGAGGAHTTLLLGAKTPDNTVYARDSSRAMVMTADATLLDDLKKGAGDYRSKDLFDARPFNTNHVEITRAGQTVAFDSTKSTENNGQNKWRRSAPNPADVDHDKTEAFLSKLFSLRAASFVDSKANTGLDKPVATVKATYEDSKHDEVSFGRSGNDVFASHAGEAGAAKIGVTDFDEALKALDEVAK